MPKSITSCPGDAPETLKQCNESSCSRPFKPTTAIYFTWDKNRNAFKPTCKDCINRIAKESRRAKGILERQESTPERRREMKRAWEREFRESRKDADLPSYESLNKSKKRCSNRNCLVGGSQPVTAFNFDRYNKDWLSHQCKTCTQPKGRNSQAKRRVEKWAVALVGSSKGGAKRQNREFDIDAEWVTSKLVEQDGRCYWYGVKVVPSYGTKHPLKPSLDRLDITRGYTKDNVVVTCCAANLGRNVCDAKTFTEFCNELKASVRFGRGLRP